MFDSYPNAFTISFSPRAEPDLVADSLLHLPERNHRADQVAVHMECRDAVREATQVHRALSKAADAVRLTKKRVSAKQAEALRSALDDLNAAKRAVKHNEVDAPSRGQPQEAKRPAEIDDSHLWC